MPDPSITLHAVGASLGDCMVRKAGCCVTLEYCDEFGRRSRRTITHPTGSASEDRVHLQAAVMALASVIKPMRKVASCRLVCPPIVALALSDDDAATGDADMIGELRKWSTFYKALRIEQIAAASITGFDLAQKCANSQKPSDTGTVVL